MKTLCVFGYKVYAPVCPVCKKDDDVEVVLHDNDGTWAYGCKCCGHELTYDELMNEQRY